MRTISMGTLRDSLEMARDFFYGIEYGHLQLYVQSVG